jgi:hypothetical protein
MQGRVAGMGGLEASDPLQFIPPPTLTLRMGDFLLVYVKVTSIFYRYGMNPYDTTPCNSNDRLIIGSAGRQLLPYLPD